MIAVPASVLGEHPRSTRRFRSRRPGRSRSIAYGHAAKLFVPAALAGRRRAPPSQCPTATGRGRRRGRAIGPSPSSARSPARPTALERLEVEAGPGPLARAALADLRPDLDLDPAGALLSTWDDDPWVGAAYSLEPPEPVRERARRRRSAPLIFAGEHLGGEFGALMEGAVRSGRAAAGRLAGVVG